MLSKASATDTTQAKPLPTAVEAEDVQKSSRHIYSVDFIRQLSKLAAEPQTRPYSIMVRAPEPHSPVPQGSRGRSPDPFNYFRKYTPEPGEYVCRSPCGRLNAEEEREYNQVMREFTPDYCPISVDSLPKDIQMGRVQWLNRNNSGRIHVQQPINGIRDIFFHIRDCELQPGEQVNLGDSVMFELSLFENRLCAIKVKKMATKVIPSPDFSRRAMVHSSEQLPKIDELKL